jgi:hypothetical protein
VPDENPLPFGSELTAGDRDYAAGGVTNRAPHSARDGSDERPLVPSSPQPRGAATAGIQMIDNHAFAVSAEFNSRLMRNPQPVRYVIERVKHLVSSVRSDSVEVEHDIGVQDDKAVAKEPFRPHTRLVQPSGEVDCQAPSPLWSPTCLGHRDNLLVCAPLVVPDCSGGRRRPSSSTLASHSLLRSTVWRRYNSIVRHAPALLIRGILERGDGGVTSLLADHLDILDLRVAHSSRDFR